MKEIEEEMENQEDGEFFGNYFNFKLKNNGLIQINLT